MLWDLLNLLIGLLAGIVSGFYFERRQTRSAERDHEEAERQNATLRLQLSDMQEELAAKLTQVNYGVRSQAPRREETAHKLNDDVRKKLLETARGMQDASGRIDLARLRLALGKSFAPDELDAIAEQLEAEGKIARFDDYIALLI